MLRTPVKFLSREEVKILDLSRTGGAFEEEKENRLALSLICLKLKGLDLTPQDLISIATIEHNPLAQFRRCKRPKEKPPDSEAARFGARLPGETRHWADNSGF